MKKNILTFFGIFMAVFLTSTSAFAAANDIAIQAGLIIGRIKPLVFIGAAIYMVWIGIEAIIAGGDDDIWKKIGKMALALGIFLIAGALINLFIPADNAVNFLNVPTPVGQ